MTRVAVFASGRGSNLAALIEAQALLASYRVQLVVSNVESSAALALGSRAEIETLLVSSRGVDRDQHERAVLAALQPHSIELVCLAGYMRVLGPRFLAEIGCPILNIHPSLLPAFPGMNAQRPALDAGVRWTGATVHFVDSGLDSGPILLQQPVPVEPDDDESSLGARILETEHHLYPRAVDLVARKNYQIRGRTVYLGDRHTL